MMNAEDGLSSGYPTCIHQDKYGFIWIGTQYGLNLYDGYEVKVFYADPKNPQSIFNNWIIRIFEEADGTIWFCTHIGISKYDRANQTFSNYIPDTLDLYNDRNHTDKIVQDGDYLWVDVWGNDLFRFNKQTGEFRSFAKDTLNPSKGITGSSKDINSSTWISSVYLFIDGSGALWVGSNENESDYALSRFK